jgi:hypothetical protein
MSDRTWSNSGSDGSRGEEACLVVDAFVDGERVDRDTLKAALADPAAREYFVDLLLLRETVWSIAPATWQAAPGRRSPARWLAAAAALAISLTGGYLAGQRQVVVSASSPTVEAVVQSSDAAVAPPPTHTISLKPGVNWTERPGGQ